MYSIVIRHVYSFWSDPSPGTSRVHLAPCIVSATSLAVPVLHFTPRWLFGECGPGSQLSAGCSCFWNCSITDPSGLNLVLSWPQILPELFQSPFMLCWISVGSDAPLKELAETVPVLQISSHFWVHFWRKSKHVTKEISTPSCSLEPRNGNDVKVYHGSRWGSYIQWDGIQPRERRKFCPLQPLATGVMLSDIRERQIPNDTSLWGIFFLKA